MRVALSMNPYPAIQDIAQIAMKSPASSELTRMAYPVIGPSSSRASASKAGLGPQFSLPVPHRIHPQGRFKADSGAALAAAAIAGPGIAALPDFLTEPALASGALVPVMSRYPVPEAGILMVRPPGRHPARKVRVLTDLLIEHFV
jgi:DNA-binding transcriptional LysR family regulator